MKVPICTVTQTTPRTFGMTKVWGLTNVSRRRRPAWLTTTATTGRCVNINKQTWLHVSTHTRLQKIEVLDEETPNTSNGVGSHPQSEIGSSYPLANLLQNVEKAHDSGKNILDESLKADDLPTLYRNPDETEDIWNDQSLGLDEQCQSVTRLRLLEVFHLKIPRAILELCHTRGNGLPGRERHAMACEHVNLRECQCAIVVARHIVARRIAVAVHHAI